MVAEVLADPEVRRHPVRVELQHGRVPGIAPGVPPVARPEDPLIAVRDLLPADADTYGAAAILQPLEGELPDVEGVIDGIALREVGGGQLGEEGVGVLELEKQSGAVRPPHRHLEPDPLQEQLVVTARLIARDGEPIVVLVADPRLPAEVERQRPGLKTLQSGPVAFVSAAGERHRR